MKLTWLTLPVFLAAGIACAHGSGLPAALNSLSPRSHIEAIVNGYKGKYAANEELAKRELMQIMLRHQQENSARLADSLNNLNSGLPSFHYEDRSGRQVRVDDR